MSVTTPTDALEERALDLLEQSIDRGDRVTQAGIADALGVTFGTLRRCKGFIARHREYHRRLSHAERHPDSQFNPATDPTPREIRERAAEVRAGWSDAEKLRRLVRPETERGAA